MVLMSEPITMQTDNAVRTLDIVDFTADAALFLSAVCGMCAYGNIIAWGGCIVLFCFATGCGITSFAMKFGKAL